MRRFRYNDYSHSCRPRGCVSPIRSSEPISLNYEVTVMRQFTIRLLGESALLARALAIPVRAQDQKTLPAAPKGFDQQRDNIPHGKLETIEYDSKATGGKRKMVVYTPPGYNAANKYPVFYLLHGGGDDETGWREKGSAGIILA